MEIQFASDKMRELFNNYRQLQKVHRADRAKRIFKRLEALKLANILEDMRTMPGRCHELKGDRAGQLSIDLDHPYRLIFIPAHDPIPQKEDGGMDWTQVTAVMILGVEDTHE